MLVSTVQLVFLEVSCQYSSCFHTAAEHKYCIHRCLRSIFCQTGNECAQRAPAVMAEAGKKSKVILTDCYHFSHLLPLEFPLSPVCARARAPLLCLSDCLCFCMCAWVSMWMRIYMCARVCSLFQRFCNLRESHSGAGTGSRAGVCLALCHLSLLFFPSASDSSNKLSRLGYSSQYKAVFPFFCSFSPVLVSFSFHKNDLFSRADTFS